MMLQDCFYREMIGIQDVLEQLFRWYVQRCSNRVCGGLADNLTSTGRCDSNSIETRHLCQLCARNLPFGQQRT